MTGPPRISLDHGPASKVRRERGALGRGAGGTYGCWTLMTPVVEAIPRATIRERSRTPVDPYLRAASLVLAVGGVWQADVMLIVISGLPATGKTTLAAGLARRCGAMHLSVDTVEDALLRSGLEPGWTTGVAAYEAAGAAAQQSLVFGLSVVVDAVNDSEAARQVWRDAATQADTGVRFVLLLPPNRAEHQRRLRTRHRGLEHVPEPTWAQVEQRTQVYEPWPDEPLVLSADEPTELLVERVDQELPHDQTEHTP